MLVRSRPDYAGRLFLLPREKYLDSRGQPWYKPQVENGFQYQI
jgi:hypothetical protein